MTAVWLTIAVLFAATAVFKAVGPVTVGGRALSGPASEVVALIAPALLAALVVYETATAGGHGIEVDERIVGLGAAGVTVALRQPMLVVVAASALAAALARALM